MEEAAKQPECNGTLEESFAELSEVMEALQKEGLPLEESFRLYQKGMELVRICNARIDTVEKKMLILDEEGDMHEF